MMSVQVSRNAGVSDRLPWTPVTTMAPSAAPSSEARPPTAHQMTMERLIGTARKVGEANSITSV